MNIGISTEVIPVDDDVIPETVTDADCCGNLGGSGGGAEYGASSSTASEEKRTIYKNVLNKSV